MVVVVVVVRGWRASVKEGDESIVNAVLYSDVLVNGTEIRVALFDPCARICAYAGVCHILSICIHAHTYIGRD